MKRIGILTSGGDCAGLNAVIRAVTYRAIQGYGWEVYGIHHGTQGLLDHPVHVEKLDLGLKGFSDYMLTMGGTRNQQQRQSFCIPNARWFCEGSF